MTVRLAILVVMACPCRWMGPAGRAGGPWMGGKGSGGAGIAENGFRRCTGFLAGFLPMRILSVEALTGP
jgi:hypothetical protein